MAAEQALRACGLAHSPPTGLGWRSERGPHRPPMLAVSQAPAGPRLELMAGFVKGDGYGHGALPVAQAALAGGPTASVWHLQEGVVAPGGDRARRCGDGQPAANRRNCEEAAALQKLIAHDQAATPSPALPELASGKCRRMALQSASSYNRAIDPSGQSARRAHAFGGASTARCRAGGRVYCHLWPDADQPR